jgi:DNA-directed RNA polymerase subunit RPC12/RpoP
MTQKTDANKYAACSYGPPDWQYQCLDCGKTFEIPAPKGPSDEKNRSCPGCKSRNIKRVDIIKSEACPPGG